MWDAREARGLSSQIELIPATQGSRSSLRSRNLPGGCQAILELGAFSRCSQQGRSGTGLVKVYKTYNKQSFINHVSILSLNDTAPDRPSLREEG